MKIKIITDSASDFTQEEAEALGVKLLPLTTYFGDEEFLDSVTLTSRQFYEKMIETGLTPRTAQVTPFQFEQAYEEALKTHDAVLCITISKKVSGCFQSANIAKERFKDKVYVVDSENASVGEQVLVRYALNLKAEGKDIKEIVEILEKERSNVKFMALLETLEYLQVGGRMTSSNPNFAIKPVVTLDEGLVKMLGKARGSKNGQNLLRQLVEEVNGIDYYKPFMVVYSGVSDEVLQKYIKDHSDLYEGKINQVPCSRMGATIGTHLGPGAIGFAFFKKG